LQGGAEVDLSESDWSLNRRYLESNEQIGKIVITL
jgi:hypothetical protein